ncbi:MAG TPA: SRPBCC family protein [Gaiellaceae bacterium]|jgi:uncharacterized protein YndB with AHSA1/START domain
MTTLEETAVTTQVYRVYIKASPQAIWDAITQPEWTQRYGYRGVAEYDLRPGGSYRVSASPEMQELGMPAALLDGEVLEADPPRKLVQTWHALWDEDIAAERPTRVTWDIEEDDGGVTRLTVTHELEGAPVHAAQVASSARLHQGGGGWNLILSDLKTLLETGSSFGG